MTLDPVTLRAETPLTDVAKTMRNEDIGDVVILDQGDQLCGIVTDRDIVVQALAEGKEALTTTAGKICNRELTTVSANASVEEAAQLMRDNAIRRLPVLAGGKLGRHRFDRRSGDRTRARVRTGGDQRGSSQQVADRSCPASSTNTLCVPSQLSSGDTYAVEIQPYPKLCRYDERTHRACTPGARRAS